MIFGQYGGHATVMLERVHVVITNNAQAFLATISEDVDATDISIILNNFNIYLIVEANIGSRLPIFVVET